MGKAFAYLSFNFSTVRGHSKEKVSGTERSYSWREMTSVTVPEGLSELLEEFAVTVLRERPSDLLEFASRYFNELHMSRRGQAGGGAAGAAVPSPQAVSEQASTAEVEMAAEGMCISPETKCSYNLKIL